MFLPTGDTPNPRNFTAWVNWGLIAANVLIFAVVSLPLGQQPVDPRDPRVHAYLQAIAPTLPPQVSPVQILRSMDAYDLYTFEHGYKPGAPELSDLFFSLFLHGGLLHLFGNMLFLWIYGDNVEHRLGRLGYLLTYLVSGVAATTFFALFAGRSLIPLVGASGAISGVLGLYFLLFPRNQVKIFIALFPIYYDVVLLPARWVLGLYLVVDNLFPFLFGAQSGVAHGAHIGGFLAGLGIAAAGERLDWQSPWSGRLAAGEPEPDQPPAISVAARLRAAIAGQDAPAAIRLAGRAEARDLDALGPHECATLAGWLEQAGYPAAAARLLRRCLSRRGAGPERAEAYLRLGLLRLQQGQAASAYQHLLDALDHDPSPATEALARQALARIEIARRRGRV